MPTYNRRSNLPRVLPPLLADAALTELIVVVDGSRDGSFELVQEFAAQDSRVRPVFIENRGSSRAQQLGADLASSEVVLIIADDVVAEPGLVTGHAKRHAQRHGLVVVGYMPTVVTEVRRRDDFTTRLYAVEYERAMAEYEREPRSILPNLWAGNVSLRRSDSSRVPLWAEEFPEGYHEDQEFGIRCLKAGLVAVFDRSLLAHHIHRRSLDSFVSGARKEGAGRLVVHRLHGDVLGALPADAFTQGLPRAARLIVDACRQPGVAAAVTVLLRSAVRLSGLLHAFSLEDVAARLLRRVAQQDGALRRQRELVVVPERRGRGPNSR